MAKVEVTVKGAGIFGLTSAYALARRGVKVRVIDPNGIGGGASGGLVGALSPHAPEGWTPLKEFQFQALKGAERYWAEVTEIGGQPAGYIRKGRLQPIDSDGQLALAHQRAENAKSLWQGFAQWDVIEASDYPWQPKSATGYLVHDTLSARIAPRAALRALAAALGRLGVEIVSEGEEQGLILHATGAAGLEELNQGFGRKLGGGQKGQAALLRFDAAHLPQIFDQGIYIVPHFDGTVAVGSTSENDYSHVNVDDQLLDLIVKARMMLPVLQFAEVIELWSGLRPRTKMRGPVVGAWPDRDGHFIVNGGFKIAFGLSPLISEAVADLITKGEMLLPEPMRVEALLA